MAILKSALQSAVKQRAMVESMASQTATARRGAQQFLTIQQAAQHILNLRKAAMKSQEIAAEALDLGLVRSSAKSPQYSLAQTLEKNIRESLYNDPQLEFVYERGKRLIGLPGWGADEMPSSGGVKTISVAIPAEMFEKLELVVQSGLAQSQSEALLMAAKAGLAELAQEVRQRVIAKLEKLMSPS